MFGASLTANAFGWHSCPHHEHRPGHGSGHQPGTVESGTPSSGATALDHRDGETDPGPSGDLCTCLGSCHAGSATPTPTPELPALVDGAGTTTEIAPSPIHRPRHVRSAYLLPFPHGPPVLG